MNQIKELFDNNKIRNEINRWAKENFLGLVILNLLLMLLVLLRSAGYFLPYLYLTINIIVFLSVVMAKVFLNASSRLIFLIALLFLIFAAFLKLFQIEIWAERSAIYTFEVFLFGVIVLIFETRS
jgi:hypothetical protein